MGLFYSNIFSIVFFCVFEISFQVVMGRMWCTAAGILDGCDMSNLSIWKFIPICFIITDKNVHPNHC